jgi:predicted DNA-binding transcriptional regulator YafY
MEKPERQLNLVALLMGSHRPLTAAKIREALYRGQNDEAFKRMFERDKGELRELGIRLDLAPLDAWGEEGYVVLQEEATLGDLGLTPAEHAALMLAAQAYGEGELGAGSPRIAGLKLAATAGEARIPEPWLMPRVDLSSPNLGVVAEAIVRSKRISFMYAGLSAEPSRRTVDPYGLYYRGAWYVTGMDHSRKEVRHFKLDRIDGKVTVEKETFSAPTHIDTDFLRENGDGVTARVAFAPEIAWWAERGPGAHRTAERSDGWVEIDIATSDPDRFVSWILGFGDHAVVIAPPELREAVRMRLQAAAKGA